MTADERAEVRAVIAFYDAHGWDWSSVVEFLVRRAHGSLPDLERWPRRRRTKEITHEQSTDERGS